VVRRERRGGDCSLEYEPGFNRPRQCRHQPIRILPGIIPLDTNFEQRTAIPARCDDLNLMLFTQLPAHPLGVTRRKLYREHLQIKVGRIGVDGFNTRDLAQPFPGESKGHPNS